MPTKGLEADRATLSDIADILTPCILDYLRHRNVGFHFRGSLLESLDRLRGREKGAEHEFLDPELEQLRNALLTSTYDLGEKLAHNTWLMTNSDDIHSIPAE
jgi:hypothetical protein